MVTKGSKVTLEELVERFDGDLARLEAAIQRVESLDPRTPEEQTKAIDDFIKKWRGEQLDKALASDEM